MIKKTIFLMMILLSILLMNSCAVPVEETTVSEAATTKPTDFPTATLEPTVTLEPTPTFTQTIEPTPTVTVTSTPKPVDLYNRLNWAEFYNSIPEEWGWEFLIENPSVCNVHKGLLVSEDPIICTPGLAVSGDLDTEKYLSPVKLLDGTIFIEVIPYIYSGPLDEENMHSVMFALKAPKNFKGIFDEVAEYCQQTYGTVYNLQMETFTEIKEGEWDYLVTKIPSWDVNVKGPVGKLEN